MTHDMLASALDVVFTTLVTALAPLLVGFLIQKLRSANIILSAQQEAKVRNTVQDILLEAEEWAASRVKANIPVTSGSKLNRAVEKILEKVPGISDAEAQVLVRQELPKVGLGAVNFLEQARSAAQNQDQ